MLYNENNMTHPDILTVEKFGSLYPASESQKIGNCLNCNCSIYDDNWEAKRSTDGVFCCMECVEEYYNIRSVD